MTNSSARTLGNRLSTLTASLALAVGGLSASPEMLAAQQPLRTKAPMLAKTLQDAQLEKALRDSQATCERLFDSLSETIANLEAGKNPEGLEYARMESNVATLREIERSYDSALAVARLTGTELHPGVREFRKSLALARFKTAHIATTLRHLAGDIERFEGHADLEGLRRVAEASTESLHARLH